MASFPAKRGWKWPRKRENKNSRFAPFLPDKKQKIPKKQQKNLESKTKTIMASFQAKNRLEKEEKEIK